MYTGLLRLTDSVAPAVRQTGQPNIVNDDGTQANFALLFETALGISDAQCSDPGASGNPFDTDADAGGQLGNYDSSGLGGMFSNSTMGQILSQAETARVMPATYSGLQYTQGSKGLQAPTFDARRQLTGNPACAVSSDGNLASLPSVAGSLNKSELSDWMDAHALTRSSHHCAMYCRLGMEAAGLDTADRPQSGDAGDYGPFLLRHGAQTISPDSYAPTVGDVVVFDKTSQHPFGHIEMYDGHHWVSDFMQHSLSPYRDATNAPPFTIYRLA
jgi:hypothetical protein